MKAFLPDMGPEDNEKFQSIAETASHCPLIENATLLRLRIKCPNLPTGKPPRNPKILTKMSRARIIDTQLIFH